MGTTSHCSSASSGPEAEPAALSDAVWNRDEFACRGLCSLAGLDVDRLRRGSLGNKHWPQHVQFDPNFPSIDALSWLHNACYCWEAQWSRSVHLGTPWRHLAFFGGDCYFPGTTFRMGDIDDEPFYNFTLPRDQNCWRLLLLIYRTLTNLQGLSCLPELQSMFRRCSGVP